MNSYKYGPPITPSKGNPGLKDLLSLNSLYILIEFPSLIKKLFPSLQAKSAQFPTHELLYTEEVEITNSLSEVTEKYFPFGENFKFYLYN
jgi:hypothetical protein